MDDGLVQERPLQTVVIALPDELVDVFSRETVERYVAECLEQPLFRGGAVAAYIPALVERFARDRLHAVAQLEGLMEHDKPTVLFVCVHNAGRSQMAAALTSVLSGGRVHVRSAGSQPASEINPAVVTVMDELGIDLSQEFPKRLTDEVVEAADIVITMGCGDACPIYPGKRYLDWVVDDPAGQPIERVRAIRDDIRGRVVNLLLELQVPVLVR